MPREAWSSILRDDRPQKDKWMYVLQARRFRVIAARVQGEDVRVRDLNHVTTWLVIGRTGGKTAAPCLKSKRSNLCFSKVIARFLGQFDCESFRRKSKCLSRARVP